MDIDEIFGESRRPVSLPNKSAIYNHSGQTGRREKERSLRIPKQLPPELFGCPAGGNSRWLDIACGREHTAAVALSLFTWGRSGDICVDYLDITLEKYPGANEFGQLGDGTESARKHPKKVKQLQSDCVISVSCGAHCTAAIAEPRENDGTVSARRLWVWGQNQVIHQVFLWCCSCSNLAMPGNSHMFYPQFLGLCVHSPTECSERGGQDL
ncbi:uncharacterized protein [Nicotiana tomentosiformis]|uniref:uncharacterized protein n=1 Tax=Nicotiana tomentosiformis TaxID=4098 RepID=UPI00051AF94B|nr:uncharacterized protein LOC104102575 isoform X2 [Nicotiana tomentosiformis]